MLINEVYVENFLGIKEFHCVAKQPVILICGNNEAGKSSVQEAIRCVLTHQYQDRINLKKDAKYLVNDEAQVAHVIAKFQTNDNQTKTKEVKIKNNSDSQTSFAADKRTADIESPHAIEAALNTNLLPSCDVKKRSKYLFTITKASLERKDYVLLMLTEHGADKETVNELKPFVTSGFEAMLEEAKTKTSEYRRSWEILTNERYGRIKAETWKVSFDDKVIISEDELEKKEKEFAELLINEGKLKSELEAKKLDYKKYSKIIEGAENTEEDDKKERASFLGKEGLLIQRREIIFHYYPYVDSSEILDCISHSVDKSRELAEKMGISKSDIKRLSDFSRSISMLDKEIDILKKKIMRVKQAKDRIGFSGSNPDESKLSKEIKKYDMAIDDIKNKKEKIEPELREIRDACYKKKHGKEIEEKAKQIHEIIKKWLVIESLLQPNAVPGIVLKSALGPFNEILRDASLAISWSHKPVRVEDDMSFSYAGRPYAFLSESSKWKVNVFVSYAVAVSAKIKTLVIDRFDVLDMRSRSDFLNWCRTIWDIYGIRTFVFGTIKRESYEKSKEWEEIQSIWLEDGEIKE